MGSIKASSTHALLFSFFRPYFIPSPCPPHDGLAGPPSTGQPPPESPRCPPCWPLGPDGLVVPSMATRPGTKATIVPLPISKLRVILDDPSLSWSASDRWSPPVAGPCQPLGPDRRVVPTVAPRLGMGAVTVQLPISNLRIAGGDPPLSRSASDCRNPPSLALGSRRRGPTARNESRDHAAPYFKSEGRWRRPFPFSTNQQPLKSPTLSLALGSQWAGGARRGPTLGTGAMIVRLSVSNLRGNLPFPDWPAIIGVPPSLALRSR